MRPLPLRRPAKTGLGQFVSRYAALGVRQHRGPIGESLHAIVVPDLDEFRRRGETAIMEMVRFEIENLSKALPPYQRIHSISIRHEPFPRTVTRTASSTKPKFLPALGH